MEYIIEHAEKTLELYDTPEHLQTTPIETIVIPSPVETLVLDIPCKVLQLPDTLKILDITHDTTESIDIKLTKPLDAIYMTDVDISTDSIWSLFAPKFRFKNCTYKGTPLSEVIETKYKEFFDESTCLNTESLVSSLKYGAIINKILEKTA
jgi:hypothetical protein